MALSFSAAAFPGAPVRAAELSYLVECIRHGWCCSVVGPSNTGKSFLLKSLPMAEVRQSCARVGQSAPVMVFIDCLEAGDSEQAFYELLLRRTIEELEQVGVSHPTTLDTLRTLHHEVLHSASEVTFRSLYARSVRALSQEAEMTFVLILDEFYDVFQALPPWPFRQLRALYDALNAKICYITATSHHLEQLRPGKEVYEFRELFHLHTLVLQPLSEQDARRLAAYLADKERKTVAGHNVSLLVELSGGHPGLLERIYGVMSASWADLAEPCQMTVSELLQHRPIQKECERLWSELEAEQEALLALVEDGEQSLAASQRQLLNSKGLLINSKDKGLTLFSPLFKAFIQTKLKSRPQVAIKGLYCDFETGQIWVDEEEITLKLSEPQRKLVAFLYQRAGVVCSYDEIAEGVWGVGEGVSPGAIYELVKRVRQKVEPDWKNPVYIITVPGKGYRLEVVG
jgi:DNA-binding winged helix-turn-helix (wHTH) protein